MNYASLVTAIQDYCEYTETDFVTHIPDFVKSAEERIFRTVQLPCAIKSATGTLTTSVQTLTHALTDIYWPLYVTVSGVPLLPKEPSWIAEAYAGAATGVPVYYATKSDTKFMFGPTPASNYAYEITYHGLPETIVTASTSWLGSYAVNALLYGSLVEAALFMRQDGDLITMYQTHFEEALQQLAEQGNYRIRKDAFRLPDKRPGTSD